MNLLHRLLISALCVACVWINIVVYADKPCAPRDCGGESVVCVCNETYWDEIERTCVSLGKIVCYTSSKCGLRFNMRTKSFRSCSGQYGNRTEVELFPDQQFQVIEGFGGSVTDAAGINWRKLPSKLRQAFIDAYFGPKGLEYNVIRVPIGGADFSTHPYTLQDYPECDKTLSNFSLTTEDYKYKLPMLKKAMRASPRKIQVVGSTWSPPAWMKTNNGISGRGMLRPEYFQTYADYHYKFIECYTKEGVPIWAVTTTNEPINGVIGIIPFNSLGWSPKAMAKWISKNLGPTLQNCNYDVKIICGDDQRFLLPSWFNKVIEEEPEALKYIDGIGVHWYGNDFSPASLLNFITEDHPDKFIIATEACEGWKTNDVILGSWKRAYKYISEIISDLSHNVAGWIDWNLCLDERGGPNWVSNFVDAPIIVRNNGKEFLKQPMFYAMGHFSKWIPRGSRRIDLKVGKVKGLELVAFRTPTENIVVVLHNTITTAIEVTVIICNREFTINLIPNSVTTVEFPYSTKYFSAVSVPQGSHPAPRRGGLKTKLYSKISRVLGGHNRRRC